MTGSSWLPRSFSGCWAHAALAVKPKIAATRLARTRRGRSTKALVCAQTKPREWQAEEKPPRTSPRVARGRQTPRSIEPRLRRPAGRSAAEAAASARERCIMPPADAFPGRPRQRLSISLVALAVELVHPTTGNRSFVNVTAVEPTRVGRPFKPRQSGNPCRPKRTRRTGCRKPSCGVL